MTNTERAPLRAAVVAVQTSLREVPAPAAESRAGAYYEIAQRDLGALLEALKDVERPAARKPRSRVEKAAGAGEAA